MSVQGTCVGHLATEHKGQQPWEQHDEKREQVTCSGAKRGNGITTERTHQDIWGEGHCPAHDRDHPRCAWCPWQHSADVLSQYCHVYPHSAKPQPGGADTKKRDESQSMGWPGIEAAGEQEQQARRSKGRPPC